MNIRITPDRRVLVLSVLTLALLIVTGTRSIPVVTQILPVEKGVARFPSDPESLVYALDGTWVLETKGETIEKSVPSVAWSEGFGTYRLELFIPPEYEGTLFQLGTNNTGTSSELLVNGELVGTQGIYGETPGEALPSARSVPASFIAREGVNTISYRVSNFTHPRGGLWEQILIARNQVLSERKDRYLLIEVFQEAIMVFITFYIAFFAFQMKEYHLLYFAAAVLFVTLGNMTRGAFSIYYILPRIGYLTVKKLSISSYFFVGGFIIQSLAKDLFEKRRTPFIFSVFSLFILLGFLTLILPFSLGYSLSLLFLIPMTVIIFYFLVVQYHQIFTRLTRNKLLWIILRVLIQLGILFGLFHDAYAVIRGRYETQILPDAAFLYSVGYCLLLIQTVLHNREQLEQARSQIITASDSTRDQIRNDLHDRLAQLTVGMEYVGESLLRRGHAEKKDLNLLRDTAKEINDELRDIINGLGPARLETLGLSAAIEKMAERNSQLHDIKIETRLKCEGIQEWTTVAEQLYLVCRESITNAVVHSKARVISITLSSRGGRAYLHIMNDGVSTSALNPGIQIHHGIDIMRSRIEALGGTFSARMGEKGTFHVRAEVPEELI